MDQIPLANTDLRASRLAFGTASLHHLRRAAERERLLLTALDHGISHFDTAPLYGYGQAETSLAALRSKPVTVATKLGLYPPGGAGQPLALVWARKLGGRLLPALSRPLVDLGVARAARSLEGSLRRLRRDHVDLLLLHEPQLPLLVLEEWQRWLETARGRARWVGVAGEAERVLPFVEAGSPLAAVIQTRDGARGEAQALRRHGRSPQITYGHLAGRDETEALAGLRQAAARDPQAVLLVGTRQTSRIAALARAVEAARPA